MYRRKAAVEFEKSLQVPRMQKATDVVPRFPLPSSLAPQCGNCAMHTVKKPVERLRGPPPRKLTSVTEVERKSSTLTIVNSNPPQRLTRKRKYHHHYPSKQKAPQMCDSSTQTNFGELEGNVENKKDDELTVKTLWEKTSTDRVDESFTVTETATDSILGQFERKLDGRRKLELTKERPKKDKKAKIVERPVVVPLPQTQRPK